MCLHFCGKKIFHNPEFCDFFKMATILYQNCMSKKREQEQKPQQVCEHRMRQSSQTLIELSPLSAGKRDDGYQNIDKNQSNLLSETTVPCIICSDKLKAMKRYRLRLLAGLTLPFSVQSLDITIISGALPFIASDFRSSKLKLTTILSIFR